MLEFLDRPEAEAFSLRLDRAEQLCQTRIRLLRDVSQATSTRFHARLNLKRLQERFSSAYLAQLAKEGFGFMVPGREGVPRSNLIYSGIHAAQRQGSPAGRAPALAYDPLDAVSFWLLKMAFSGNPELAEWHMWTESLLLYYNLNGFNSEVLQEELLAEVSQFLERRPGAPDHQPPDFMTAGDLQREGDPLFQLLFSAYKKELSENNFGGCDNAGNYLVTSKAALRDLHGLVASRRFMMLEGRLVVHRGALDALFLPAFERKYRATRKTCAQFLALGKPQLQELFALCRQWQAGPVAMDTLSYVMSGHRITLQNIDQAMLRGFFPPCMLAVAESFKSTCHMKHPQRIQLTPFLVDCGMSVDEDLEWQRRIYARDIGDQKFSKEYAYNIKHMHGTVGGRKVAHCSQCAKIIDTLPCSERELCGCPFKYMKGEALAQFLSARYRRQVSYMDPAAKAAVDRRVQHVVQAVAGEGEGEGKPVASQDTPSPAAPTVPISPIDMQYITMPAQIGDCKTACSHLLQITYGIEGINVQPVKYYNAVVRCVRGDPQGGSDGAGGLSGVSGANMSVDEMRA